MSASKPVLDPDQIRTDTFGVIAVGASDRWEASVLSQPSSGPAPYLLQIESPALSLNLPVSSPAALLERMIEFLDRPSQSELTIKTGGPTGFDLLRDDEIGDRIFLVLTSEDGVCVRLTLAKSDWNPLLEALRQVQLELRDA